jgi:DNA-binding CsgD family transcriptional regulator
MGDNDERGLRLLLGAALLIIIVGGTVDLVLDAPERLLSVHVIYEVSMIVVALGITVALWRGWWLTEHSLAETQRALEEGQSERNAWRASAQAALDGLGRAMDEQFRSWDLTPSEREIALLLLKGHSHKSIARATGRSERTVRQHAVAVYQKSGLRGRAELAAFFLEDIMLPGSARAPVRAAP